MKLAKVSGPRRRATPLGRVLGCSVWGETGGTRTDEPEPITCARLCKTAHIARFLQTAHAGFFFMKNLHSIAFGCTLLGMTNTPIRRSLFGAFASLAPAAGADDSVYAAIERHRAAWKASEAAMNDVSRHEGWNAPQPKPSRRPCRPRWRASERLLRLTGSASALFS
jgi:hypothetical protein